MQSGNMTTETSELRNRNNLNGTSINNQAAEDVNNIKTEQKKINRNALIKLKSYLIALRVWSLSASIIPTILGELIEEKKNSHKVHNLIFYLMWRRSHTSWSLCSNRRWKHLSIHFFFFRVFFTYFIFSLTLHLHTDRLYTPSLYTTHFGR